MKENIFQWVKFFGTVLVWKLRKRQKIHHILKTSCRKNHQTIIKKKKLMTYFFFSDDKSFWKFQTRKFQTETSKNILKGQIQILIFQVKNLTETLIKFEKSKKYISHTNVLTKYLLKQKKSVSPETFESGVF